MVQDKRFSLVVFWLWSASKKKKRRQNVDFFIFINWTERSKSLFSDSKEKIEIFGKKQEIWNYSGFLAWSILETEYVQDQLKQHPNSKNFSIWHREKIYMMVSRN